jgi:SET domain-containing protein
MAMYYRSRHPLVSFRKFKIQGTGSFAKVDIRRGKRIVEYDGLRLSQEEAQTLLDRGNVYIFTLNNEVAINGWVRWNMARFINHSCEPSCERLSGNSAWQKSKFIR